jgi:hypothetical protein
MALPPIIAPPGTPVFLAEGHDVEDISRHAQVRFATGHGRARPVRSALNSIISVEWFLEAAQLADVRAWYEDGLEAGARSFSAYLKRFGAGMYWREARWLNFETEMLHFGRGRVSGRLFLFGPEYNTGPTVNDLAVEVLFPLQASATPYTFTDFTTELDFSLDAFVDETS